MKRQTQNVFRIRSGCRTVGLRLMLVLVFTVSALYPVNKVGTSIAQFLKIGPSARALGLGEAMVADGGGIDAIHYNTAGLAHHGTQALMFSQSNWLAGTDFLYVGGTMNLGRAGVAGLNVVHLNYGDELVRTVEMPEGSGEVFNSQDISMGLSYAARLTDRFSMGGQLKYISQQIWHMQASTMALDLGALFELPFRGIRLGMNISNFGGKMMLYGRDVRFYEDPAEELYGNNDRIPSMYQLSRWPLPITYRIGLSGMLLEGPLFGVRLNLDALHPSDNLEYLNVGAEAAVAKRLFLRAGMRTLFLEDREGGFSLGAGLHHAFSPSFKIQADYAWVDYGRLNAVKMLSFSILY